MNVNKSTFWLVFFCYLLRHVYSTLFLGDILDVKVKKTFLFISIYNIFLNPSNLKSLKYIKYTPRRRWWCDIFHDYPYSYSFNFSIHEEMCFCKHCQQELLLHLPIISWVQIHSDTWIILIFFSQVNNKISLRAECQYYKSVIHLRFWIT